jgi:hypothetical protein
MYGNPAHPLNDMHERMCKSPPCSPLIFVPSPIKQKKTLRKASSDYSLFALCLKIPAQRKKSPATTNAKCMQTTTFRLIYQQKAMPCTKVLLSTNKGKNFYTVQVCTKVPPIAQNPFLNVATSITSIAVRKINHLGHGSRLPSRFGAARSAP